jgi:hypothetical protein
MGRHKQNTEVQKGAGFQNETVMEITMNALSEPFEGSQYVSHPKFPGRLLVVGESAYLTDKDLLSDFTVSLLSGVAREGRASGGRVTYYRKLFFVLTGKRSRDVDDITWQSVWHSLAYYHFVQTALKAPRARPTIDDWQRSKDAFTQILSRLRPTFILITGKELNNWIRSIAGVIGVDEQITRVPILGQEFALATWIYHPSSIGRFKSLEARTTFERLTAMS